MRISRKVSATIIGTPTFIIQVSEALPAAPNLWPAMNTQLRTPSATFGSASMACRSSRSQAMHSTPCRSSAVRVAGSEKRATPMTRLDGAARLAKRASVGPILPPTPSTMMSPSTLARSATSAGVGSLMKSSSASTSAKRRGNGLTKQCPRSGHAPGSTRASSRRQSAASASRTRSRGGCSARALPPAPSRHARWHAPPGRRFPHRWP